MFPFLKIMVVEWSKTGSFVRFVFKMKNRQIFIKPLFYGRFRQIFKKALFVLFVFSPLKKASNQRARNFVFSCPILFSVIDCGNSSQHNMVIFHTRLVKPAFG